MPNNLRKAGIKYNGGGQPVFNSMGMRVPGMRQGGDLEKAQLGKWLQKASKKFVDWISPGKAKAVNSAKFYKGPSSKSKLKVNELPPNMKKWLNEAKQSSSHTARVNPKFEEMVTMYKKKPSILKQIQDHIKKSKARKNIQKKAWYE